MPCCKVARLTDGGAEDRNPQGRLAQDFTQRSRNADLHGLHPRQTKAGQQDQRDEAQGALRQIGADENLAADPGPHCPSCGPRKAATTPPATTREIALLACSGPAASTAAKRV